MLVQGAKTQFIVIVKLKYKFAVQVYYYMNSQTLFLLFDDLSKWIKNPFWRLMTLYKINVCTHIHLELSHDHTFKIIIRVSSIITLIKQGSWQHPNHRNGLFLPTINPWCKGKFFIVLSYYSSWNLDLSFG